MVEGEGGNSLGVEDDSQFVDKTMLSLWMP